MACGFRLAQRCAQTDLDDLNLRALLVRTQLARRVAVLTLLAALSVNAGCGAERAKENGVEKDALPAFALRTRTDCADRGWVPCPMWGDGTVAVELRAHRGGEVLARAYRVDFACERENWNPAYRASSSGPPAGFLVLAAMPYRDAVYADPMRELAHTIVREADNLALGLRDLDQRSKRFHGPNCITHALDTVGMRTPKVKTDLEAILGPLSDSLAGDTPLYVNPIWEGSGEQMVQDARGRFVGDESFIQSLIESHETYMGTANRHGLFSRLIQHEKSFGSIDRTLPAGKRRQLLARAYESGELGEAARQSIAQVEGSLAKHNPHAKHVIYVSGEALPGTQAKLLRHLSVFAVSQATSASEPLPAGQPTPASEAVLAAAGSARKVAALGTEKTNASPLNEVPLAAVYKREWMYKAEFSDTLAVVVPRSDLCFYPQPQSCSPQP